MSLNPKKIFVFGATGKTGQRVVDQLQDKGLRVMAGVRDLNRAKETLGAEGDLLEFVKVDLEKDSTATLAKQLVGCDGVVCATGFSPSGFPPDPAGAIKVDYLGTKKITNACTNAGVPKMVVVTSLLTNGILAGQALNPQFVLLNLFGGVLFAKRAAEIYIEDQANLDFTIVRPGGLKNDPPSGEIVFGSQDTIFGGGISRDQVATVVVEALYSEKASNKIVEIVAKPDALGISCEEGFASIM